MSFVESPRVRRRLAKLAVIAVAGLVAALVVVFFPNTNGRLKSRFSNEPTQRVVVERQVPVTRARRAEVNALFDEFVPAALMRRDPEGAYDLVTPEFRAGGSGSAWRRGDLPVYPYSPRGHRFHGWTVDTSYRDTMSVELFMQPLHPEDGPVDYSVDLRRLHGKWLIDSFYPRASYAPVAAGGRSKANGKAAAPAASTLPKARGGVMWILIGVFFSLIVAVPVALFTRQSLSNRRSRRRIEAELRRSG
jgi:hypothetical protein